MSFQFFLLTETSFHACYLVTEWMQSFQHTPEFGGIVVREDNISEEIRSQRECFHQTFRGKRHFTDEMLQQMQAIYPHMSQTERAMVELFGIPAHSATFHPQTTFLGHNLNSLQAWQWLVKTCELTDNPFLFIFLDQLLQSWWIEQTGSQIINAHSAVLPYARGMHAIENIAALQDKVYFQKSVGATVHYIDTGIDTGPIIRVEKLKEPFHYRSIWEVKAHSLKLAFDLLIQTALNMLHEQSKPLSVSSAPAVQGPNFQSKHFTLEVQRKAEEGYLKMKH